MKKVSMGMPMYNAERYLKTMNLSWAHFVRAAKGKDIVCYGAGVNALQMLANKDLQPFLGQIRCFVDRDCRKHGKRLTTDTASYDILPVEQLEKFSDCIVLVTLTDYLSVGEMLDRKGVMWFSWTMISGDLIFDTLVVKKDGNKPAIFLLNTPDYMNLGDQAIAYAEDLYIRKNFGDYYEFGTYSCHPAGMSKLKEYVKPEDIILIQGGGNIGSLWRVCEEILRDALQKFPDNPIIVFPQSVFYGDSEEEQAYFAQSQGIYNSHKKLLICTRDRRSYNFVQNSYNCKSLLLPDMVLTLKAEMTTARRGIGVLLRCDKEQSLPDDYEKIVDAVINRLGEEKKVLTHHPVDTVLDRENKVKGILKEYASCRLIITDRLHGMIFATITGTPCIAFDNSYCKVSDVYGTWLKEISYITVCKPLTEEELFMCVKDKLKLQDCSYEVGLFEEYFKPLTDYIKLFMKRER